MARILLLSVNCGKDSLDSTKRDMSLVNCEVQPEKMKRDER